MGSWTIQTTSAEDEAIHYVYEQYQKPPTAMPVGMMGMPLPPPPMPPPGLPGTQTETVEQWFDRMTHQNTVNPMTQQHTRAKATELLETLATIPPENRDAAQADLELLVEKHGGESSASKSKADKSKTDKADKADKDKADKP